MEQGKYYLTGELRLLHSELRPSAAVTLCVRAASLSDPRISAGAVLCYCCGLRAFKELAYKYRQNIPSSELPGNQLIIIIIW